MNCDTRWLLVAAVVFVALLAVGSAGATAAQSPDSADVGADATINETTIDVAFIGTVIDEGTATVEASGVLDDGQPVTGAEATVTIGGEPVATATVTNGTLTTAIEASVLDLEPTDSATVGLQGYTVEDPATVAVVHEAFELDAGFDLRSVPQGAELSVENVEAVNVWNATAGTYDAVTDPTFEGDRNLHQGVSLASDGDGRLGYTFDAATADGGVVELAQGWNYVGSNFNVSATTNLTVAEDLALVEGDVQNLDVFTADFGQQLDANDTVGAYDSYWVYVDSDQPVVREVVSTDYDRDSREDLLGATEGDLNFSDQATASSTVTNESPTAPGIVVENVEANTDSAVVVTYEDGGESVIAGLATFAADDLDGGSVTVPVGDFGGFPGPHTAHIVPVDGLSGNYTPGDTVSTETAGHILDSEQATVFQSALSLEDQTVSGPITEGDSLATLETADLLDGAANETAFTVDIHPTDDDGNLVGTEFVGSSDVLAGSNENVTVTAEQVPDNGTFNEFPLNGTDEYVAMVHLVDDGAEPGDPATPGQYAVLPNANATDGFVPGGVTDRGEIESGSAVEPVDDDVLLDSVSSLLNASMQPLTDDSITAIEAEPTASNTDADGNGDAVNYPNDTDIPVMAVDGSVVGVTGPFVTTDTEFANYSNEEILLNLYDELLGGSGTVLHDEGHGQFYTLAPNGGDDFQAFAGYAENNGYTYDNTTDIESDLGSADAVVITTPPEAFTQSELDALSTFVDDGGVVFLHDQSDFNDFDATDNHNEIASALGADFRFNDDQVVDDQNNVGVPYIPTTGNFNDDQFPALFEDREGLGFELDVNETYEVDVVSVADGDTVNVEFADGTVETVRIVGIDTPETGNTAERLQEYEGIDDGPALKDKADEATAYAEDNLANRTVNISFDPNEGLRGNFGRLLGFLELPDGSVYNEEVIKDGWARVYDSGFADHDEYLDFEQQARANDSGIWEISDPAATPEIRDDPVSDLFFPDPVAVTGPETPVSSENGESLVALDSDANVAAIGGPFIEEGYESAEGGPGIDQYEVFPFLTNVIDAVGNATGPVLVDSGHGQFASDFAVSAEDAAYYLRYLEGQSPDGEPFIGFDGVVNITSDAGPDLVEDGEPAARALLVSTPTSELSPAERTAVTEFADAGGAVVLFGSAIDKGALSNFDPLLNDLDADVGFTETNVTDSTNNLGGDSSIPTTSNFEDSQFPGLFTAYTSGQPSTPFNVSDITPADATVSEGEAFDVSATVTNAGSASDEQAIELRLEPDGSAVRTQTVQLDPGQSTTVTFADVSVGQAGEYNHTVASPDDQATGSLTVEQSSGDPVDDDVLLDSVSSLLDANMQPLTDDSITAIEAESTASNEDSDGNGDAVTYPSDVDIPVVAVDGGVVGITGPFVTTNTDFANYSNEEILLNLYDELLGGSGTVLHDEGHGQFYTLAPNGGDDFQAFADYAESNGYTYDNTTDIESDLGGADAVVITTPSEAFTQSELDALSTFVDDGGVVFLHDQSDYNDFDATDNHNEIASALGVEFRFNDDQVVDDQNNAGASFVPTTGNFNEGEFPALFEDREGIGFDLDVNETYEVDVVSVADGDTADVEFSDGTVETVRIVGIDTPETGNTPERLQEYEGIDDGPALKDKADEATAYAEDQLADKTVNISFDPNEGLRGNFGRLLGFLELPDGTVYNEEVIKDGWARVYDSGFGDHDEYLDFEQQARANNSGIWDISDPAATPEIRDDPVSDLFFPDPVAVTGPEIPVSSENGESLVALDSDANVAAIGGPLIEEQYEADSGGPGIDQYEVFPFLTNVIDAVGNATGPVLIDSGHGQFASDFAVSAEDVAYYQRYLEGQSPGSESFIGLDGVVNITSDAGPDLLENGEPAARAVLISTPTSELSPAERTAVSEFADAGGAVVLFGTAVDKGALSNFDPLLSDLDADVGFTETSVTDSTNNLGGDSSIPTTANFAESQFPGLFTAYTSGQSSVLYLFL